MNAKGSSIMKKALRIVVTVILIILFIGGLFYKIFWNAQVDFVVNETTFPLSTEQKLEDFKYLFRTLEQNFPYFEVKKRQHGMDWLAREEEFVSMIAGTSSDAEFYEALERILILLQNGHTNIIEPGVVYEDYARIYSGSTPWSQIYNDNRVRRAYDYWDTVIAKSDTLCLPVSFKYIEGEYYAWRNPVEPEGSPEDFGIPSGSRLCDVGSISVDDYVENLVYSRFLRYDRLRGKAKVNTLIIYSDSPVQLGLETPTGDRVDVVVEPGILSNTRSVGTGLPEHLFSTFKNEEDGIAYLKLPSFSTFYVDKDAPGIRTFLEEIKDYKSLIIDIRGNGGGSTQYWEKNIVAPLTDKELTAKCYVLFRDSSYLKPFLKHKMLYHYLKLKDLNSLSIGDYSPEYYFSDGRGRYKEIVYTVGPNNPVGFKGRIFLLVDDAVYSSSESFAMFAKTTGWATLVGTDTGGDGIGFDPIPLVLPNSGLVIRFPGEMGLNPDGAVNEEVSTKPDIYVEQTLEDFLLQIQKQDTGHDLASIMDYDTMLRKAFELAGFSY